MKTQRILICAAPVIALTLVALCLTACSGQSPRVTPGKLEISENVTTHKGKITNIIQLSEKEAPPEKVLVGVISGAVIGHAISENGSDEAQELVTAIGAIVGEHVVMNNYGKTIYRLQLLLDNGTIKEVYVRGGSYTIGKYTKVTVHKHHGDITSLVSLQS
ncbi:hypothetical protein GCM10009133_17940 [Cocleimonas flava]|uniref:Outer membrane lipoprotein SlyB n=1 Tax=Cocleimonas flava TaxID=634765 RepID=A0A4R1EVI2_9GAMM|nr:MULTISPECIES: hypothetical protein [Cocleimonas]MEB8433953.1 hypothetical protein [Cocleimonas sp. KMM 6892]MEC4716764.1 hypothetical protein [Cocleimonas sp. KMM 6895]MEC4746081.1 hypothetical protein [Cocleimonas sp. KMM 6896]TCJ84720.1 hypothetical protein EV695_2680 [Cocleimonas flava]